MGGLLLKINFSVGVNMYKEKVTYVCQHVPNCSRRGVCTSYWYLFLCSHRNVDANMVMISGWSGGWDLSRGLDCFADGPEAL